MSYRPIDSLNNGQELFTPPLVPSQFDDEFAGKSLDPKWTVEGTLGATPAAIGAAFGTSEQRHDYATRRPSALSLQNGADSVRRGISQLLGASAPVGFYWIRSAPMWRFLSTTDPDGDCDFGIYASTGANVDFTEGIRWRFPDVAAGIFITNGPVGGGGGGVTIGDIRLFGAEWPYLGIRYTAANTADLWAANGGGNWQRIGGTVTYTGGATLDRVALSMTCSRTDAPGNLIWMLDFFRYKASLDLP